MVRIRAVAMRTIRALRETWFEPAMVSAGGEILKRLGDGWIVSFADPVAAIETTIGLQEKLASEDLAKLRIGMHIGEIVAEDGDYYGVGINLATRIEVEAPPGGVMISSELAAKLPDPVADLFRDAGNFRLKNIALPVTLLQWRPARSGNTDRSSFKMVNTPSLYCCRPPSKKNDSVAPVNFSTSLESLS